MLGKLLDDVAAALLAAQASRELIEDVRQERENVRAWMTIFAARARMLRLDRDELACLAERLDTALPKLETILERDRQSERGAAADSARVDTPLRNRAPIYQTTPPLTPSLRAR